jgi:hypothetical protein
VLTQTDPEGGEGGHGTTWIARGTTSAGERSGSVVHGRGFARNVRK